MTVWQVYKIVADDTGELLYVGRSADVHTRTINHRCKGCVANWAKANPDRDASVSIIASFTDMEEAAKCELETILELKPLLNKSLVTMGGAPRCEDRATTASYQKPWLALKISRRTWYRSRSPADVVSSSAGEGR